ncbi:MAG TPA: TetR family transcriptional regulator, partial [Bifidobacterium longum]|nr:TetR family transcriptional regulator [Bifidobacterium longum]
ANMQVWSKHLPERFLPLIEAGVKDGSIPTEYPREAAELLSLLPNYWLMPYFYPATLPEMEHRIRCLATMLDAIGVPIFDDELITVAAKGMMTFAGEPEKGSE